MTSAKHIMIATAIAATLSLTSARALEAADDTLNMKPFHGISFNVGSKRAVSYFLNSNGQCNLVVTLADEPKWDGTHSFTATRFEATIAAGEATRFHSAERKALEFACHAGARSMSVKPVEQLASGTFR